MWLDFIHLACVIVDVYLKFCFIYVANFHFKKKKFPPSCFLLFILPPKTRPKLQIIMLNINCMYDIFSCEKGGGGGGCFKGN
jgi:hypothetical protein